jgi:hypothetical protein
MIPQSVFSRSTPNGCITKDENIFTKDRNFVITTKGVGVILENRYTLMPKFKRTLAASSANLKKERKNILLWNIQ